ncbi:hypothetical protein CEXT_350291 [Caerostris extrusa]|uniref:Uncharacterized protein n=1 Tax=Caerostris extrusa TaxID=172846 RepID=A0AAV4Y187_CAEEX|nr:hypothetical protein CEXT_350291 [Caerostris extrusa]
MADVDFLCAELLNLINLLSGGTSTAISQKDCESSCPNLLHSRLSPYVMISSLLCDPNGQKGGGMVNAGTALKCIGISYANDLAMPLTTWKMAS